jgi:hypothetical protein
LPRVIGRADGPRYSYRSKRTDDSRSAESSARLRSGGSRVFGRSGGCEAK